MTSQEQLLLRLGSGGTCLSVKCPIKILGLNFFSPRKKKGFINVSDGFIINIATSTWF